jgi:hypothetical protein
MFADSNLQGLRRDEGGTVLPLVGLCIAMLMGFGGLAVDVGYWEYQQREQQNATDAAALGAAQQLAYAGCPNPQAAGTAALGDAAKAGFANGGNVAVTVQNPPPGIFASNDCAVGVQITTQNVATFFSRLFGTANNNGMIVSSSAVATVTRNNNGCIYLLSPTTDTDFSNSNIDAPNCQIYINASANMSNSTIDAAAISYAGTTPNESGAKFPEATPAPALPIADPCPEIAGCEYLTNNAPSTSSCSGGGTYNNATLNQGCYSSLTLTGTDTLNSGLYVINGQLHMNNATVTGNNVTIYMTNNVQDTNFSNANLTLSAPTTGDWANVLFYRIKTQSSALDLSTCTCSLTGLLYFPTTQVNYSNTGDTYSVLVFGSANFSTSQGLDFDYQQNSSIVGKAVLVQ